MFNPPMAKEVGLAHAWPGLSSFSHGYTVIILKILGSLFVHKFMLKFIRFEHPSWYKIRQRQVARRLATPPH